MTNKVCEIKFVQILYCDGFYLSLLPFMHLSQYIYVTLFISLSTVSGDGNVHEVTVVYQIKWLTLLSVYISLNQLDSFTGFHVVCSHPSYVPP